VTVKVVVFVVPLYLAEMVTAVEELTVVVVTVNDALVAPAGTITLAGVDAAALLSASVTTIPPVGAAPFSVTVPVDVVPPFTLAGLNDTLERTGWVTVNVAVLVTVASSPEIVTETEVATGTVVIANVAFVAPARTVTLVGTVAAALLSESVTTVPPTGAAPLSFTVPVDETPPRTLVGVTDTEESAGGLIVRFVVLDPVAIVAVIVTGVEAATGVVVTVKVAVRDPEATVTFAGAVAAKLLLESVTSSPPAGAALLSVTVPLEDLPPVTAVGLNVTDDRVIPDAAVTVSAVEPTMEPDVA